ncbi:hypothetical protein PENSPDRAFT_753035 [Peniophora sp. CONT]|nr:hypothetical protein PENSPDRAFT_753035 [Peniophora sp. CONT]
MAGGRIVQYGRRTKRALEAGSLKRSNDTAQPASSPPDSPAPPPTKQLKKLRDENVISVASSAFSAFDSPQPKPARRARKKMIVSSPSTSPVMSSKIRRVNPPAKPAPRPKAKPVVVVERAVLGPAASNVPKKAVITLGKSGKTLADSKAKASKPAEDIEAVLLDVARPVRLTAPAAAPTTPARAPKLAKARKQTPKKSPVELDIVVVDDAGKQHSHEKRVSRPDVVVNPAAGPSRQAKVERPRLPKPVFVSNENDDDAAPARKPTQRRSQIYVIANPSGSSSSRRSVSRPQPVVALPHPIVAPPRPLDNAAVRQPPRIESQRVSSTRTRQPVAGPSRRTVQRPIRPSEPIIVVSDSEDEDEVEIQPPARSSKKLRVDSSDESSDDEVTLAPQARPLARASTSSQLRQSAEGTSIQHSLRRSSTATDSITSAPRPSTYIPPSRPIFANRALPPSPPAHFRKRPISPVLRGQHARPSVPPSSSSSDELDDSFDLETELQRLEIGSSSTSPEPVAAFDASLQPLLAECDQPEPFDFSSFISTFPFDPVVAGRGADVGFQKIGEASYSEVFGIGDVVLKVVPLRSEATGQVYQAQGVETPPPSEPGDVLKEITVTRTMGEIAQGFVKLLRTYVVRGKYPSLLLDLWDDYNESKGSESIRPDMFTASQTYAIIVLPNGGPDLEAYTFERPTKTAWRQASSIFWQVARALANAESLVSFEHRDLHWGQILVRDALPTKASSKRRSMDDISLGVQATVIDLGLARMSAHNGAAEPTWTPFDEEIFEGEGDYQFDIYRLMREHHGRDWSRFRPLTNVMWLHYLTRKLLKSKGLRAPPSARKSTSASSLEFSERDCYEALVEVDELLGRTLEAVKKSARKGRRMTQAAAKVVDDPDVRDSRDVVKFGARRGWIRA